MKPWGKAILGFGAGVFATAVGAYTEILSLRNDSRGVDLEVMKFAFNVFGSPPSQTGKPIRIWSCNLINSVSDVKLNCEEEDVTSAVINTMVAGNPNRTDLDLFICEVDDLDTAEELRRSLSRMNFGNIFIKRWDNFDEYEITELRGYTTVIVDAGHPERGETALLQSAIENVIPNPNIRTADNTGAPTPWRISVIICP